MTDATFEQTAHVYGDMLYRIAFHALGSHADAEDVVQTVFLRLYEYDGEFDSEEHRKHWLLRVAVNESRKLLRAFWRRRVVALDEEWDAPAPEEDEGRELLRAVMALEGKYRVAVYLYYYEGCSVKETAALMGAKPSTVQTWLQRAREKLRAALGGEKEGTELKHPDLYRKACSESMRLSGEKLEEMIFMTENKKHGLHRPVQIGLIAAALAAALCITAAAANPEMVTRLWKSFSLSVIYEDENMVVIQTDMPEISVERVGDRVVLTVDDVQIDITEDLERDGVFTQTFEGEKGTAEVTVQSDLTWGITMSMEGGEVTSYHSDDEVTVKFPGDLDVELRDGDLGGAVTEGESFATYTFTDDESVTDAIYLPPEE